MRNENSILAAKIKLIFKYLFDSYFNACTHPYRNGKLENKQNKHNVVVLNIVKQTDEWYRVLKDDR